MAQAPAAFHYVIVRADLPVGFAAAQICHAAGESVAGPVAEGTNAVILAIVDEAALLALADRLTAAGEPHVLIREPDAPWRGAATAIGLAPRVGRLKLLSSLPLYGRSPRVRCLDCAESISGTCYTCNGGLRRRRPEVPPAP